jgi:hypothetical protein
MLAWFQQWEILDEGALKHLRNVNKYLIRIFAETALGKRILMGSI